MDDRNTPSLKELLESDKQLLGMWVIGRDPFFAEVLADIGFDLLLIESEHHAMMRDDIMNLLIAIRGSNSVPMVRMPWNDQVMVKQVLDMGTQGLIVPMINTADDARRLVAYAMYPPRGNRGYGPVRAGRVFKNYQHTANDLVCLFPQIEHIEAVNNLE